MVSAQGDRDGKSQCDSKLITGSKSTIRIP